MSGQIGLPVLKSEFFSPQKKKKDNDSLKEK